MCFNIRKLPPVFDGSPNIESPSQLDLVSALRNDVEEQRLTTSIPPENEDMRERRQSFFLKTYKLREIKEATQNFSEKWLLGEGGFGKVYRGSVKHPETGNDVLAAVKRLNSSRRQGKKEWLSEILVSIRISHPNLVQLYGFCNDEGEGLLVYEYLPLGSLDKHLFGPFEEDQKPISWEERLRIAYQCALALAFLHENGVIHRDFKAPNVLLNESRNAMVADFGLAKFVDENQTHVSTNIMGTLGYLDPRYIETGELTKASDVFAYGVFLLELLTGRPARDSYQPESMPLPLWCDEFFGQRRFLGERDVSEFVDPLILPQLTTRASQTLANRLAITAKHCVKDYPSDRPLMEDIVMNLNTWLVDYEAPGK